MKRALGGALLRHHAAAVSHVSLPKRCPAVGSRAVASTGALAPASPVAFREAADQLALTERQEGFLLERLPEDWDEERLYTNLKEVGIDLGPQWRESIMLMRTRLGRSMGRALVAVSTHSPHATANLPAGTTYRPTDRYDIMSFVEQCERLVAFSDDLHRLASPENFLRTITITEVPSNYGRKDIVHLLKQHCNVVVRPQDVVFRFKRWGRQSDTCYVICPTEREADHCLAQIQELAVPKRAAYGSLFGATFLWSRRGSLFLSDPELDFLVHDCNSWVFTTGWHEDMTVEEFQMLMDQLKFHPTRVVRHYIEADQSSAFFMRHTDMDYAKRAMKQLRRMRHRWRIKPEMPFVAYPRRVDVHRLLPDGQMQHEDEDSAGDEDLDEPAHY